jgi:hypothetical protein
MSPYDMSRTEAQWVFADQQLPAEPLVTVSSADRTVRVVADLDGRLIALNLDTSGPLAADAFGRHVRDTVNAALDRVAEVAACTRARTPGRRRSHPDSGASPWTPTASWSSSSSIRTSAGGMRRGSPSASSRRCRRP